MGFRNHNTAMILTLLRMTMPGFSLLLVFCALFVPCSCNKPHIIFIFADDMGWNDVSFHGSPQIPTPNIDALAASGVILNNHYSNPTCSPSRASLMTGRYAPNTGLFYTLAGGQPSGLPLNFTTMPQYLKALGYATHMIGKWHLGYHKTEYTPPLRGFDSFFGFLNGVIDYYDHTFIGAPNMWGIDLQDGLNPAKCLRGKYATDLFTERAEEIIENHNTSQPLFLYFTPNAPHTANFYQPLQAPPEAVAKFKHIKNITRRTYAGAAAKLDDSVGKVIAALDAKSMLDNSIILFLSDNGAEVEGQTGGYGSNWPLRGSKYNVWEGAVRVPALIWSPLLQLKEPRVSTQRMHISDWLPTLYSASGGDVRNLGNIDGIDMWQRIKTNLPSLRTEILVNIDPIRGLSGLIQNDYKLVNGTYAGVERDLWYGPSGRDISVCSMDDWVWQNGSVVKDILQRTGRWLIKIPNLWRKNATVNCGAPSPPPGNGGCDPTIAPCLFNITADPCEYNNLASQRPQVVRDMMNRILELKSKSLGVFDPPNDPNADPRCHGFHFVPWLDEKHSSELCGLS